MDDLKVLKDTSSALDVARDDGACLIFLEPSVELIGALPSSVRPRRVRRQGEHVARLIPRVPASPNERSLSGYFGLGLFPFHTDCAHHYSPPHFGAMRLLSNKSDRTTLLSDGQLLLDRASDFDRAVCLVSGGQSAFLSKPFFRLGRVLGLRWDPGCMRSADSSFDRDVAAFVSAVEDLPAHPIKWTTGLTLIWNNWRLLHARSLPERTHDPSLRVLDRVLFDE